MYKNNSRDNREIDGCNPLQLHCKLKSLNSAVGYYSYTHRYTWKGLVCFFQICSASV